MAPTQKDLTIPTLGEPSVPSPLKRTHAGCCAEHLFVTNNSKIRYHVEVTNGEQSDSTNFEMAGPRETIFFEPAKTTAAIVTCGGLSPGLNNVVQSIVLELYQNYGVKNILGIRYGFAGFKDPALTPITLTPDIVHSINQLGGSILGSSRGPVEISIIVDKLVALGVNILFTIGGDGTQRGAASIAKEIKKRELNISVIGIPKTIDNDVPYVWQTFGFSTAVERAREVIMSANLEAQSFQNSVCIVKLMGRSAGFISLFATLAAQSVDFTLIPEVPFALNGAGGILDAVHKKLLKSGSAIIVVAEGAGQEFFDGLPDQYDASGNKLQHDIGLFLKDKLTLYLTEKGIKPSVKYFDPGYSIRAVPANVSDAFLCDQLSRSAVHAAMAGKTNIIVGQWYNNLVHVPISLVCSETKRVNPKGRTWQNLLAVTQQNSYLSQDH